MPSPLDWLKDRAPLPQVTLTQPGAAAPPDAPPAATINPQAQTIAELEAIRHRNRLEQEIEELEEERRATREERREEREARRAERKARMDRLAGIAAGNDPHPGAEAAVLQMVTQVQAELRDTRTQLLEAQRSATDTTTSARLEAISRRLDQIGSGAQQSNSMEHLVETFQQAAKVRSAIESVMPPPPPPTFDANLSQSQMLERERILAEAEIRREDRAEQRAAREAEQQARLAEIEASNRRMEGVVGMGRELVVPLASAILGERAAAMFGGTEGGAQPAPPAANGAAGPTVTMLPWRCAAQDETGRVCNTVNYAPAGSQSGVCAACHTYSTLSS